MLQDRVQVVTNERDLVEQRLQQEIQTLREALAEEEAAKQRALLELEQRMAEDSTNKHERLVLSRDLNQVIVPRSSAHFGGDRKRRVGCGFEGCVSRKKSCS